MVRNDFAIKIFTKTISVRHQCHNYLHSTLTTGNRSKLQQVQEYIM